MHANTICGVKSSKHTCVLINFLLGAFQDIQPADVILVEGILLFYFPEIRNLLDMKIFADMDCDTRLSRRVSRDVALVTTPYLHTCICSRILFFRTYVCFFIIIYQLTLYLSV